MTVRRRLFFLLSSLYWAIALVFFALALLAPCGLAPGAWCEEQGPSWLGATLGALKPWGVLVVSSAVYGSVFFWLSSRRRKVE
jgi:L-asparagine transporter-like permease